jgi:hypothetical protein
MAKIIFKDWPGGVTRTFNIPDNMLPEIEVDYGDPELHTLAERANYVIDNIIHGATRPLRLRRDRKRPSSDITDVIVEE